jgi:hypothetical protein
MYRIQWKKLNKYCCHLYSVWGAEYSMKTYFNAHGSSFPTSCRWCRTKETHLKVFAYDNIGTSSL